MNASETIYDLTYNNRTLRVHSPLLGKHNISNHLAAAGLCLAAGIDLQTVVKGLEAMKIVPGRLEAGPMRTGFRRSYRLCPHRRRFAKCAFDLAAALQRQIDCRFRLRRRPR